jgi:pantoate--beta-alanine ligase
MYIIKTAVKLKELLLNHKISTLGFVPTMGALHSGHIDLIKRAVAENQWAVCSIFVNPTQFNNPEDLKKYPRTLDQDIALLEAAGCQVLFCPEVEEMYPSVSTLKFDFGHLEHIMEGKFRPGHFNGVGIIVTKLFHMVKPTRAYFGLKDIQQVAVVSTLVKDLSFDLEIVPCPTVREASGLAMSSRNRRLSPEGLQKASELYASLRMAKEELEKGKTSLAVKEEVKMFFKERPYFELEYFEMAHLESLLPVDKKQEEGKTAIILAAFLDGVRLIDNLVF